MGTGLTSQVLSKQSFDPVSKVRNRILIFIAVIDPDNDGFSAAG